MADRNINYNRIEALVADYIVPKVTDNFFLGDPTMVRLRKRVKKRQLAKIVTVPLRTGPEGGGGSWYGGDDIHDTTVRDNIKAVTFFPKNSICHMSFLEDDELAWTSTEAVINGLQEKGEALEQTVRDLHNKELYNAGTNPKAITGLAYALPTAGAGTGPYYPNVHSYGGISCGGAVRATDPAGFWQHNLDVSVTTPWTAGAGGTFMNSAVGNPMSTMFSRIGAATNQQPTLIISPWASWTDYHDSLVKRESFFRPQQPSDMVKSGFEHQALMYKNALWLADGRAPSASNIESVFVVDESSFDIYWDPRRFFYTTPIREPYNQSAKVKYLKNRLELVFRQRRTSGVMRVDVTAIGL